METSNQPSESSVESWAGWSQAFERLVGRDLEWIAARRPPHVAIAWDAVAADLGEAAREVLCRLCAPVLVLELNCARLLDQLVGDTPEQRHRSFLARFDDDAAWAALFEEYRDLGARVEDTRACFRTNVLDLLTRLGTDAAALEAAGLPGPGKGPLSRLSGGHSDPHRGNNGVWCLTFGDHGRLIYKPKPLAVDVQFQRTLARCNAAIARGELAVPALRTVAVVDRGSYGWCEYVAHAPCADGDAVERFYRREGALLAVLHLVLAVDIHHENLIASGEHPVVVDLETLFHPYVQRAERDPATSQSVAEDRVEESALRVGLLPWRALASNGNDGVNLAAMGDGERQVMPFKVPRWVDIGRDDMRLERVELAVSQHGNLPRVGDAVVPWREHADAILESFTAVLAHVASHREEWLAELDGYATTPTRVVVRATQVYGNVLRVLVHPDCLRDRATAEAAIATLDGAMRLIDLPEPMRHAERLDLMRGDVPFFSALPSSVDVWDARDRRISSVIPMSGLAKARAQVAALNDAAIANHVWLVRAALGCAEAEETRATAELLPVASAAETVARRAIGLAGELAERVARHAIAGSDGVAWVGSSYTSVGPLGCDLYEGSAGIGLFLAQAGRACRDDRLLTCAERAAAGVWVSDGSGDRVGGFMGIAGRLYALCHIAAALDRPAIVEVVLDAGLRRIGELLAGPCASDVLHGAAGSALALLAVLDYTGREAIVPVLDACLAALERDAVAAGDGLAWRCAEPELLVGLSHGAAGIVCAMARLGRRFAGDSPERAARCERLVAGALRFERGLFDRDTGRWPDRRRGARANDRESTAWCHGAPGIALSRLDALGDPEARAEIAHAIEVTLAVPRSPLHGLCHGAVGNLVLVDRVARVLGRAEWAAEVATTAPSLVDEIAARPRVDFAFTDSAPGLLLGMSGVGHGLLVLADPSTPLVLAFDPPETYTSQNQD